MGQVTILVEAKRMTDGLFRPEVAAARKEAWIGTIRIQAPRLGWWALAGGFSTLAALAILVTLGTYASHERTAGSLVSSLGLLPVSPRNAGTVTRVWVVEGQHVRRGDPLIEVSQEQTSTGLSDLYADIGGQLKFKLSKLQNDREQTPSQYSSKRQALQTKAASLDSQLAQLQAQTSLQRQRSEASMSLYQQWTRLAVTGLVSKLQVLQQRDSTLQIQATVRELERQVLDLRQQRAAVQADIENVSRESSARLNEIDRSIADVNRELAQNETSKAFVIRAPGDGVINNILINVGQAVTAGQQLGNVVPTGASLRAELWLPSKAIGFVERGDRVVLRYEAFPYQRFGQHRGTVEDASTVAVDPSTLTHVLGKQADEARFRVFVKLDEQAIQLVTGSRPLMAGMSLEADITLQRRPLIDWLLDPLRKVTRR